MRQVFLVCALLALVLAQDHSLVKRQTRRQRPRVKQQSRKVGDLSVIEEPDAKRVVCYYTNWAVYRKGIAKFTSENINPYLCTHLVYAFGGLTDDFELKPFDEYEDIEQSGYSKFNNLKQYNKGLKTLLAVGGWNEGSARFSELVASPEARQNLTQSSLSHLRRYGFDGLDLDWEYPASRDGSAPEDKENYAILVKELREAYEAEGVRNKKGRLLLTMAVPAGQTYIDKGFDIPTLNKYLDFFNMLTYDYHSSYEPNANHHAPITSPPGVTEYEPNYKLNIDWTIRYYLSKGADKNKLVVGIPTYGRSFTLSDPTLFEFGSAASGPGVEGKYSKSKGFLAFFEICEAIAVEKWEVRKPYHKKIGPFAYKGNQWVGYDDEHIAAKKGEYVRDNKLGGIMFWSLDSADFRGICNGKPFPILEAAKTALYSPSPDSPNAIRGQPKPSQPPKSTPGTRRTPNSRRTTPTPIDPFNTPEPPTTPSPSSGFKCKKTGFFPNPTDCHKYFWCLDSGASGLGVVAHNFNCPANLIFNKRVDGCDHPSSTVKCKINPSRGGSAEKKAATTTPFPTTTAITLNDDYYYYDDALYYDDYLEPLDDPPPVTEISNHIVENGRPQFDKSLDVAPVVQEPESSRGNFGGRPRPQYTNIERPSNVVAPVEARQEPSNVQNRPQYTVLERGNSRRPVDQPETEAPSNRGTSRNYVTISRNNVVTSTISSLDESSPADRVYVTLSRSRPPVSSNINSASTSRPSTEYVTIRRARPSTLSSLDSDNFTPKPDFISTFIPKTTTSTIGPRIRVPTTAKRFPQFTRSPLDEFRTKARPRSTTLPTNKLDQNIQTTTRPRQNFKLRQLEEVSSQKPFADQKPQNIEQFQNNAFSTTERQTTITTESTTEAIPETTKSAVKEEVTNGVSTTGISVRPLGNPIFPTEETEARFSEVSTTTQSPFVTSPSRATTPRRTRPVPTTSRATRLVPTTSRRPRPTQTSAQPSRSPATRRTPRPISTTTPVPRRTRGPQTQRPRVTTPSKPASNILDYNYDYVYYDDGALGGTLRDLADYNNNNAILLPDGSVECYDTGYFAHPDSCKKFISCSKNVRGAITGWVYTCPSQLVFDPVGAMCNWAEAVDCQSPN